MGCLILSKNGVGMLDILTKMRIGDENRMPDLKQYYDRHALILTKMRIGDENGMADLKQD